MNYGYFVVRDEIPYAKGWNFDIRLGFRYFQVSNFTFEEWCTKIRPNRENFPTHSNFIKFCRYHEKDPSKKDLISFSKKEYATARGHVWNVRSNKNSSKLKNSLKLLEEEFKSKKIVYLEWQDHKVFQLMLSNGLLIYVEIDNFGDLKRINFDKYFIGKIVSESICDGELRKKPQTAHHLY